MHNVLYDDPRRAAAFPAAQDVDWRRRVVERDYVWRIMDGKRESIKAEKEDEANGGKSDGRVDGRTGHPTTGLTVESLNRLAPVLISLFEDLPPAGVHSKNARIIEDILSFEGITALITDQTLDPQVFAFACHFLNLRHDDKPDLIDDFGHATQFGPEVVADEAVDWYQAGKHWARQSKRGSSFGC